MERLQPPASGALLVGTETSDDAGVYRLSDREAVVVTADFITPPSDDPRLYGQIAAANSISDVYAMGGRPLTALALCMFPKALEPEAAAEILAGGQDKVTEAGAVVAGGHTVRGDELFYGLSVTGVVDPQRDHAQRRCAARRRARAHQAARLGPRHQRHAQGRHRRGRRAPDAGDAGAAQPRRRRGGDGDAAARCTP